MIPQHEISAPDDLQETFDILADAAGLESKLHAGLPTNEAI